MINVIYVYEKGMASLCVTNNKENKFCGTMTDNIKVFNNRNISYIICLYFYANFCAICINN